MKTILAITNVLAIIATPVYAQDLQKSEPKTKLEAFTGTIGAVVLKGYTRIGSIKGTGSVQLTAMMFRNAATAAETSGIIIEVHGGGTSYSNTPRSFIDYDEINGLLEGMDYISRTDPSVTKLKNFEAIYTTKGDLKITVFNQAGGKLNVAVQSGRYSSQNAFLTLSQLKELRALIVKAKQVIDRPANIPEETKVPVSENRQPLNSPSSLFAPSSAESWKR